MELTTINNMAGPEATQGARDGIIIPAPAPQIHSQHSDEDKEKERRFKVQPLEPSRYLKEISTGHVHKWSPEFGARSDLMEPYNPTLPELLKFGEYANDLLGWGYTAAQLWQSGATAQQLSDAQVPLETMIEIGVPPETLQSLGHAIHIEAAPIPTIVAPSVPTVVAPATAPVVQTSTSIPTAPSL